LLVSPVHAILAALRPSLRASKDAEAAAVAQFGLDEEQRKAARGAGGATSIEAGVQKRGRHCGGLLSMRISLPFDRKPAERRMFFADLERRLVVCAVVPRI